MLRPGSFQPIFGVGSFGLGRLVVSTLVGGLFRPFFGISRFGPVSFRPKSIQTNKALTDGRLVW